VPGASRFGLLGPHDEIGCGDDRTKSVKGSQAVLKRGHDRNRVGTVLTWDIHQDFKRQHATKGGIDEFKRLRHGSVSRQVRQVIGLDPQLADANQGCYRNHSYG